MEIDGDGMVVLAVIPMAVVFAFLFSFIVTLAAARRSSTPANVWMKAGVSTALLAVFLCASLFIAIPLFYPVYMLFLTLPKQGLVRCSCGAMKYLLGSAPFAAVCLGLYFFLGVRAGARKKALLPGAIFSMFVLLGPMMCLYAKVECLTAIYDKELKDVKISFFSDIAKDDIVFMKVFEYGDYKAKTFAVVCVPPGGHEPGCNGSYYYYKRDDIVDKWKIADDNSLWGVNGDYDLPWPPY